MVLRLLWYVVSPHALQQSLNNFETPQAVERTQTHVGHHEKPDDPQRRRSAVFDQLHHVQPPHGGYRKTKPNADDEKREAKQHLHDAEKQVVRAFAGNELGADVEQWGTEFETQKEHANGLDERGQAKEVHATALLGTYSLI